MSDRDRIRALYDLLATAEIQSQREYEKVAAGWIVVVVDDESGKHVFAVGTFSGPEAALIHSAKMHEADERLADPGDALWSHHVLPLLAPEP